MRSVLESGLLAALTLTGVACGAGTQQASTTVPAGAACQRLPDLQEQVAQVYDVGRVRQVAPLYRTQFLARAIQPRYIAGAELHLDAERGVSQPYLQRVLACHVALSEGAHPADPLSAPNIQNVTVRAEGHRFVVTITGADRQAGKLIWQKARALTQPTGHVEVEQLSAAKSSDADI